MHNNGRNYCYLCNKPYGAPLPVRDAKTARNERPADPAIRGSVFCPQQREEECQEGHSSEKGDIQDHHHAEAQREEDRAHVGMPACGHLVYQLFLHHVDHSARRETQQIGQGGGDEAHRQDGQHRDDGLHRAGERAWGKSRRRDSARKPVSISALALPGSRSAILLICPPNHLMISIRSLPAVIRVVDVAVPVCCSLVTVFSLPPRSGGYFILKLTRNSVPQVGSLLTLIVPCCASVSCLVMASPSPCPPPSPRALSPR